MEQYIYTVLDRIGGYYRESFFLQKPPQVFKVELERNVKIYGVDPKAHLEDCEVYLLGVMEDITAQIKLLNKPEFVIRYSDILPKKEEKQDGQQMQQEVLPGPDQHD